MANDFSRDTFCRALYRFEAGALLVDSKGNNTLTNHGGVAESATCKEGSKAADFEDSLSQYFSVDDAALDAGFPLKNGDVLKIGTICFWMRSETNPGSGNYDCVVGKWDYAGSKISLAVYVSNGYLYVRWGYGASGQTYESWSVGYVGLVANKWYHVGISFDGIAKTCHVRLYNETDGTVTSYDKTFTNELRICDAPFTVGSEAEANYFDGILDEVVVFNRRLWDVEIDNIRLGRFAVNDFSQDTRIAGHWRFEGNCNDERHGNHLTLNGSAVWTSRPRKGSMPSTCWPRGRITCTATMPTCQPAFLSRAAIPSRSLPSVSCLSTGLTRRSSWRRSTRPRATSGAWRSCYPAAIRQALPRV